MYTYFGQKRTALFRHCFSREVVAIWVTVIANPDAKGEMDAYLVIYEGADRTKVLTTMLPAIPTKEEIETLYQNRPK